MILDKLRVRGKLNFLLALPLAAVILVAAPFVVGQVEETRSAATTADAASKARQLGALVWELQRERLLTAGYLASPTDDGAELMVQQQVVADTAESVRVALGADASDELVEAVARVQSLRELRQGALARGVSLESVARTFHAVVGAVLDGLRLAHQRTSDAEGTRQLTAIDALLRANEENALRGMALLAAAANPKAGLPLLEDASAQAQMFTVRFVQQSDVGQARLVVLVDQGEAARRVDALVDTLDRSAAAQPNPALVPDALAAVDAQSTLRRLVQDRVTREIADAAAGRAADARNTAWTVGLGTALLFLLVMALAMVVSRSIARPLQQLTVAAGTVADVARAELLRVADVEHADEQPPRVAAIDVKSGDEIGDLATAFNRVQTTAAMLVERQLVTRRNVSLIFANVAQRTQNLVSRQLVVIDELERDEQNTELLGKLYRLDHLSTRLRRNAKNLLVVAGAREQPRMATPTPLVTAVRAGLAEIEDYQRVRITTIPEITVAPQLGSDLVLVFAELLENATAFSPPDTSVEVQVVAVDGGGCTVTVVDHGIGMTPDRLADENRRMVERERLDIAPTSVLGLFVVGRLSRRHGLAVQLSETAGGGVTAVVRIPANLATLATAPTGAATALDAIGRRPQRPALPTGAIVIPEATSSGPFAWFAPLTGDETPSEPDVTAVPSAPALPAPVQATAPVQPASVQAVPAAGRAVVSSQGVAPVRAEVPPAAARVEPAQVEELEQSRNGLTRRVPGARLQPPVPTPIKPPGPAVHDAVAARDALDSYQSAIARAAAPSPNKGSFPLPTSPAPNGSATASPAPNGAASAPRSGLARRVPGAHLAQSLRQEPTAEQAPSEPARRLERNPELDRAVFDAYAAGLARADAETSP